MIWQALHNVGRILEALSPLWMVMFFFAAAIAMLYALRRLDRLFGTRGHRK